MFDRSKNIIPVLIRKSIVVLLLLFSLTALAQTQDEMPAFNPTQFTLKLKGLPKKKLVRALDSTVKKYGARNPEEGITVSDFAIRQLGLKGIDKNEFAIFFLRRAQYYSAVKKYALSLNDLLKAEEIYFKHDSLVGLQQVFNTYANLYTRSGQNAKAIKYALRSKQYAEKLKETESIAVIYNTIAILYKDQEMYDSSMHYYRKALALLSKRKNYQQIALLMDNISMVWLTVEELDSATFYNQKALEIAHKHKDAYLELQLLLNYVSILDKKGDYKAEIASAERAKHMADSIGVFPYQVYTDMNVGAALMNLKQTKKAIDIYRRNLPHLAAFGDLASMAMIYDEMSKGFESLHMPDSALHYYKLSKAQADSSEKHKNRDQVNELIAREQMNVQEQKIKYLNELNQTSAEKNEALDAKNTLQKAIIWISVFLLVVIVVLLVITFKRFKDNKKLTVLLEYKNTEITDSINYAQRIQFALLPGEKEIRQLLPGSFIIFKPKDIVSGDFYWVARKDQLTFVAVGDCTGHGVPGGFMSMLGHSFLNEIIVDKHVHEPGRVLDILREKVINALKQTGAAGENKDGMDISLVAIDETNGLFTYAAANNTLYMAGKNGFTELAADKQPIGFYGPDMKPFATHRVSFSKGDCLYLVTDGYADQFGGPKGKKLLYKRMKEHMMSISGLSPGEQQAELEKNFMEWKKDYEQVDDVCVMGIRL